MRIRPLEHYLLGNANHLIFWAMLIIAQMSKKIALNTRPQKSESCDEDEVIRLSDHRSNIGGGSRE